VTRDVDEEDEDAMAQAVVLFWCFVAAAAIYAAAAGVIGFVWFF
jgi:hypothetical protein